MITKEQLLAAARASAALNGARPLTKAFAEAVAAELASGDPAWWLSAEAAWKDRFFPDADRALRLLWATLHFEALGGNALLAPHLPSCRGAASPALGPAVRQFLAAPPEGFRQSLYRSTTIYSPFWTSQWLEPAKLFFQGRSLPFHVVDMATAGGLGACADLLVDGKGFDASLVEARVGLAHPPLDLRRDDDARWLVACCLPDDIESISTAAFGARRVRELRAADEDVVQLGDCAAALTPAFVAKNVPPTEDVGLLLFTWGLFETLTREQRRPTALGMARALEPWGDRALWVAVEKRAKEENVFDVAVYRRRGMAIEGRSFNIVRVYSSRTEEFADKQANAAFLA